MRVLSLIAAITLSLSAHAALTVVTPVTWNIVGLDSNSPATGPHFFPVGARICSDVATTNVAVQFVWDSPNTYVNLRTPLADTLTLPSIAAGGCSDAYFEVDVTQNALAFDTARRFHITATDVSGTVSTPVPRELYVEHLISQNRNSVTDVKFGPNPLSLTSVPAGGAMNLVVGNTYTVQLIGGTATQGYNQFEEFINFPNTIFQVLAVSTTYSADNSPYVPNPNDKLYADACLWQTDPNAPTYRSCVGGDFKAGGSNVVTTYTIKVISGGGTSQPLNSLLYDFSGSSFHYNADYSTGARIANVIDPTSASISKSFSPNPASLNGVTALTITITNPNAGAVSGYNVVDNLPANLLVATPPAATTSGCGTPTLTATAGSSSISFSNGTIAANSNCVIKVNVTPTATGSLVNTTNHLFVDTNDTGQSATSTLTVNTAPPPGTGICGQTLARWNFPTGMSTTAPAATTANVTATAAAGAGLSPQFSANDNTITPAGTGSWSSNGSITTGATLVTANNEYFEFALDTTGYSAVYLTFDAEFRSGNGPTGLAVYYGTSNARPESGTQVFSNATALSTQNTWMSFGAGNSIAFTSGLNPSGNTYFRIYSFNSGNVNPGSDINIDNVLFTGCNSAVAQPTLAKSFSPNPVKVNGVSTLTFTLTNPNTAPLTGAKFMDTLPAGTQVAATPAASTTCTGSPTWAPTAGATTLAFGQTTGATIPASGSCTVSVNITATTAGPHTNVSGNLSTTESGTNTASVASDTLTAVLPPSIAKAFAPSPILANGITRLTFTITNPNSANAISGVAFSDILPTSPGAMKVAAVPNLTTTGCGAPAMSAVAGAGVVGMSAGTIAAGGTCVVTVDVTAPSNGTYNNTSGNVSHIVNAEVVAGNTASASVVVNPPNPSIALLKQIGLSPTGPWLPYVAVTTQPVYYRFTIENTGDVPLSPVTITDDTLNVATCNAGFPGTLPVAVAANDDHIATCVVGPVATSSGSHTNTAHATGTYLGLPHDSGDSTATYATAALTLAKSAVQSSFSVAGDTIDYDYLVTNSGFAELAGPVTVTDDKTTVTCPPVTTVGDLDNWLDPGESITCTAAYLTTIPDVTTGFVTNTAHASADGVDSPNDSETVFLSTTADVALSKTLVTGGPYTAGQSITYTLQVTNNGPSTATSIQVTDTPSNLTITNVTGACVALPCTIASLASGANTSITVTATIDAAGAFDNSATAMAAEPDPIPANNTDNTGNNGTAGASVDVVMAKTLITGGPYVAGQSITYTLQITNNGPSTATSIQVTDTPTNLTITNVTGACVVLPCTIASLANGASTSITVTATIGAAGGAFDNSATATPAETDTDPGNNTDSTGNNGTAAASVDVVMQKTLDTAGPYFAGQSITYTLQITNNGPSTATSIQVTDTPTNLTITNVAGACVALPCTIANLANGANTSITVTATIDAAGAFDNSATATPAETDSNPANNTDNTGNNGIAAASADVVMAKTLTTGGPFVAGQSVTYTLQITNNGPSTATSIQVTDTPTNLTITNVAGACVALPCTIASLANGANTSITVTATIDADGAFDNSATATPAENDPNPGNNTDNTGNNGTAAASVDVVMVKTLTSVGPFSAGQSITYTLQITNNGPSAATSIQVTDTPTNLTITNVTGACAALPCTIANLANGANTSITVTATIDAAGAFDNSATATPAETDSNPANNTDSTGNNGTAAASVDVVMVKTLTSVGPFSAGQSITYTLQITNNGPSPATSIQVTDTPTNLTITNVTGACVALPCTIANLANGANTSITVTATIDAAGAFDNSATATPAETDSNPANNTDSTGNNGTAAASVDVVMVKTLTSVGPFSAGQSITYTLQITNNGPSAATSIQVTDTPTNLTITNVTGACVALPCTIANLANSANTSITVTATIDAAGAFDNSATATPAETDSNPANNTDSTGNNGTAAASVDVVLVKTLTSVGPFSAGQSITYTLQITNNGPSPATGIQVTDTPTNLTITNVTGACVALPCTIASLANGANTSITVTATIDAAGAFDNSATATPAETDSNPANNTDSTGNNGTAAASVDVVMVKTLTSVGPFSAGQSITYTLQITNNGPSPATSIQVTDTPTNLTITNVTGACVALPCTIANLANGANTSITVTATIDAAGAFDNSATATPAETDSNPANNTDSTGNNGTAAASVDVVMVKTLTSVGPFSAGQSTTYTLQITNNGPSAATSIQVTDSPTNLTITNVTGACVALPCTIANLANGANTSITVTATIDAAGAFDNAATATPAETDSNPANNTDSTGNNGTAAASVDVVMVKTLTSVGPFSAGQSITYTLQITNNGPSAATSIQVTDTPTNLTITNVSGACVALPCTIANLANGANTSITVTATIDAAGAFDNSATATPAETDSNPANNTDSTGNNGTAAASVDVVMVKTLTTVGPFSAGQSITYTLQITNNGPSAATSIQVTDTPTNLTITNVTGACVALPCTIANLANGANTSITVTATIDAAGAFDNSATATPAETDSNPANNTDSTGNNGTAAASVDVVMVKALTTVGPFSAGQSITYTLQITNNGPSAATNIQVTDTPTNLTITNVSGACAALPCTIANLANGANTSITVTATIDAAGAFDNSATATPAETDSNPANNTDSTGNNGTAAASVDVVMVKTLTSVGPFSAGQSITYTLQITNNGPSPATNIQVADTPTNLTITNVTGACVALPCTIANLANGANTSITVTATIDAAGAFDNSATATPAETDSNPANNTDNTGNNGLTGISADVSVVKTLLTAPPFSPGQAVSYSLVVSNAGPSPATNIQVTDTPTNLTITSVSGACAALPCTIASLASGANTTVNVTATINAAGAFDNIADAVATEPDPNMTNNNDSSGNGGVTAVSSADVGLTKTASLARVGLGQAFDYTIVVTNHGPSTATGVVVTDTVPASFSLSSATSTQGTCTGSTTVTCTIGTMLDGASVTITLHGTATGTGSLSNTATVTRNEVDPDPTNDSSTAVAGLDRDIPTASDAGLLLLGLLLGVAGLWVMRGRL